MNQINNLITDLNNDSTLLTQFQSFCQLLATDVTSNLNMFYFTGSLNTNITNWLNDMLETMIQNNLSY